MRRINFVQQIWDEWNGKSSHPPTRTDATLEFDNANLEFDNGIDNGIDNVDNVENAKGGVRTDATLEFDNAKRGSRACQDIRTA